MDGETGMGKNPIRKRTYGFFKAPSKLPMFTHLVASDLAVLDKVAERFGIGQGTLASFYLSEILRNEDFMRVLNTKLEDWDGLKELQDLGVKYRQDKKLSKLDTEKLSKARVRCGFCAQEMYEYFLPEHLSRVCKKVPKLKALPDKRPLELLVATRV